MEDTLQIDDGLYWVGVNDRESTLFESMWPIPTGVSYNSYLILDDKTALLDTVKGMLAPDFFRRLSTLLPAGRKVDYLILHHLEPDHSGAIPLLVSAFPNVRIIGTKKAAGFLRDLYGITENVTTVEDGEELSLGHSKLRFLKTPMVHWPETMMSYDCKRRILFSGDAFGGFGVLEGDIFDSYRDSEPFEEEILRYFSNIVGKFSPMVQKALDKIEDLEIRVVAPTHGPIWRERPGRIIELYDRWSRHEPDDGVTVVYGSMYGNTRRMMEAVLQGLAREGCSEVRVHNISRSHPSFVIRDVWKHRVLILGGPTYDAGLFPPLDALVRLLADKMLKNRSVGVFGSFGWSGGGVSTLSDFVENSQLTLIRPVVEARFAPLDAQIEECRMLGQNAAKVCCGGSAS